ncbi:MAG: hypothetical protein GY723_13305, partial [bacterium]|nr:hypothetical protein [bacterium]
MGSNRDDKVWVIDQTKHGEVIEPEPGLKAAPLVRPVRPMRRFEPEP